MSGNSLVLALLSTTALLFGTTLLTACATPDPAQVADGDRQVCIRETPIGSLRPTTTCRTVAQMEKDRQQAQKDMNLVRQDSGGASADRIGR